jgi:hypothetical protein
MQRWDGVTLPVYWTLRGHSTDRSRSEFVVTAKPKSKRLRAIDDIQKLILGGFPDARFVITPMPDSRSGTAIWTYTSADWDEISDLVLEKEVDLLVNENIFLGVIPMLLDAFPDGD